MANPLAALSNTVRTIVATVTARLRRRGSSTAVRESALPDGPRSDVWHQAFSHALQTGLSTMSARDFADHYEAHIEGGPHPEGNPGS